MFVKYALAATALLPSIACAQSAMVVGGASENAIHAGTTILLETRDGLTTEGKKLKVGAPIEMNVVKPVLVNNQVVIPAGSRAVGEVTSIRNKGMWGKSGGITARALYVEANGRQIRLNGNFDDRGSTGTVGVVAAVAFIPVAGFFVTGTSAKMAPGTHVTASIAEEVPVTFAAQTLAPAPMMAPVPAQAPPQPVTRAATVQTASSDVPIPRAQ